MRRKSERVKDKDKSTERKSDRGPKKSRRSSRRRKKSSSTSQEEESETDECDASFKSCVDDIEEEHSSSKNVPGKSIDTHSEINTDVSTATEVEGKESPHTSGGRSRRHFKKHSEEVEEKQASAEQVSESQDKVEGADAVSESLEKHKENENKSSVWQVKSTDCSGGEIKKLKLCIVRPPEPTEPEPRKRKKLSRMPHRETEGELEGFETHDSPDEKKKNRKSASNVKEDSKYESRRRHGSGSRKTKADDSSDNEQPGIDSTDHVPRSLEISLDKEEIQEAGEESSQDINKKRRQDPRDRIEENSVPENSVIGDIEIPTDNNNIVESSRSPKQATTAGYLDPFDQLKLEKPRQLEPCSAENLQPSSSSERSPENCHNSPKETKDDIEKKVDASSHLEEKPKATDLHGTNLKDCNLSDKLPEALDTSEVKSEVSHSPETSANVESRNTSKTPESLSEIRSDGAENKPKTKDSSIENTDSAEHKTIRPMQNSSEKTIKSPEIPSKKSTLRDSSDSEEERLNYRKLHESKKSIHRLTRHTSDTKSVHDKPERTCDISVPPSRASTFKVETSVHKSDDLQNSSKSTNKHTSSSKDSKHKDAQRDTPRLERKKHKSTGNHGRVDNSEKPLAKEKVSLKRSTARVNDSSVSGEILEGEGFTTQDSNTDDVPIGSEPQPNLARKRRWGASKSTTAIKKPTLSISSDSLKHLIPEVKPLPISEVQLTEDEDEEEEGEVLDKVEDSFEIEEEISVETQREEEVQSNNHTDEKELLFPLPTVPDPPEAKSSTVRKISIISADAARLQRSPSPARHRASNVLFVTNLVRPFTVNQLRELLARTGTIVENGFWIDKIKSKCYVQYETDTEAQETRHALHGVRWPVSNPKQLSVDYAKKEDMDLARDLAEGNHIPRKTEPLKMDRMDGWLADQGRDKDREVVREERDRDRDRARGKERHAPTPMDIHEKSREAKMAVGIREWDLGKMDMGTFDERGFHREERNTGERERRIRKERGHRSPSREPPGRKVRKKDEEAPAKLLDDLFKKTKITPCVYWLPLTADQIVVKEEMRRKHMAEHERRMAEMRKAEKAERERQRARMQGRSSQRRFDDRERDKRRHRSRSGSSKK